MFSIADLIQRARENASIESDYRLAKIIGINQSALSNYKAGRTMPDERVLSQLCALSGDDVAVFAAQIQAERARTPEGRTMWEAIAQRLRGGVSTAILSVLFSIGLIAAPVQSARAGEVGQAHSVWVKNLYIVSSAFLSVQCFLLVRLRRMAPFWRLSFGFFLA